ncbi:hypothetical protein MJO28_007323 [Puccinia striiformis f. sp. tritici]|uniref:Uncharacterized protein n=1 Tax=Puccinia striiformis f. sp. tritici TaxID=168172 RepID=A0ACC0EE45_9BASI|nr:hypothetical protein Pst134EB_014411 [Puccinia striiformis f. sp. tritici]KAI7951639.1 hypothetical protein MJO28_007323 [Puccinia striiformis f. sp. tritici]
MDISELTRAKLANNQQSSLLKLVLWSNLLNNTQEQETRDNQKTQAEHDWFEHIMDQFNADDSDDSEADSSDLNATPEEPLQERGIKRLNNMESIQTRPARRRRLLTGHSTNHLKKKLRTRQSSGLLSHWGFLWVKVTDKEEEDEHLPSLVPLKTRYQFQSGKCTLTKPVPSASHAIDFRTFQFIISATSTYDRHAVHIKYLIGQTSSSVLHYPIDLPHHHHHESLIDDDHYQFYCNPLLRNHHQYYPNVDDCTLITGKIPSNHHPQFRVTQLDILLDYHLKPPSLNTHSDTHYKELLSDAVDPDCCPVINHHHQLLFWKIFVLH